MIILYQILLTDEPFQLADGTISYACASPILDNCLIICSGSKPYLNIYLVTSFICSSTCTAPGTSKKYLTSKGLINYYLCAVVNTAGCEFQDSSGKCISDCIPPSCADPITFTCSTSLFIDYSNALTPAVAYCVISCPADRVLETQVAWGPSIYQCTSVCSAISTCSVNNCRFAYAGTTRCKKTCELAGNGFIEISSGVGFYYECYDQCSSFRVDFGLQHYLTPQCVSSCPAGRRLELAYGKSSFNCTDQSISSCYFVDSGIKCMSSCSNTYGGFKKEQFEGVDIYRCYNNCPGSLIERINDGGTINSYQGVGRCLGLSESCSTSRPVWKQLAITLFECTNNVLSTDCLFIGVSDLKCQSTCSTGYFNYTQPPTLPVYLQMYDRCVKQCTLLDNSTSQLVDLVPHCLDDVKICDHPRRLQTKNSSQYYCTENNQYGCYFIGQYSNICQTSCATAYEPIVTYTITGDTCIAPACTSADKCWDECPQKIYTNLTSQRKLDVAMCVPACSVVYGVLKKRVGTQFECVENCDRFVDSNMICVAECLGNTAGYQILNNVGGSLSQAVLCWSHCPANLRFQSFESNINGVKKCISQCSTAAPFARPIGDNVFRCESDCNFVKFETILGIWLCVDGCDYNYGWTDLTVIGATNSGQVECKQCQLIDETNFYLATAKCVSSCSIIRPFELVITNLLSKCVDSCRFIDLIGTRLVCRETCNYQLGGYENKLINGISYYQCYQVCPKLHVLKKNLLFGVGQCTQQSTCKFRKLVIGNSYECVDECIFINSPIDLICQDDCVAESACYQNIVVNGINARVCILQCLLINNNNKYRSIPEYLSVCTITNPIYRKTIQIIPGTFQFECVSNDVFVVKNMSNNNYYSDSCNFPKAYQLTKLQINQSIEVLECITCPVQSDNEIIRGVNNCSFVCSGLNPLYYLANGIYLCRSKCEFVIFDAVLNGYVCQNSCQTTTPSYKRIEVNGIQQYLCLDGCQNGQKYGMIYNFATECLDQCPEQSPFEKLQSGKRICVSSCNFYIEDPNGLVCSDTCTGTKPGYMMIQVQTSWIQKCFDTCPNEALYYSEIIFADVPKCESQCNLYLPDTTFYLCRDFCLFVSVQSIGYVCGACAPGKCYKIVGNLFVCDDQMFIDFQPAVSGTGLCVQSCESTVVRPLLHIIDGTHFKCVSKCLTGLALAFTTLTNDGYVCQPTCTSTFGQSGYTETSVLGSQTVYMCWSTQQHLIENCLNYDNMIKVGTVPVCTTQCQQYFIQHTAIVPQRECVTQCSFLVEMTSECKTTCATTVVTSAPINRCVTVCPPAQNMYVQQQDASYTCESSCPYSAPLLQVRDIIPYVTYDCLSSCIFVIGNLCQTTCTGYFTTVVINSITVYECLLACPMTQENIIIIDPSDIYNSVPHCLNSCPDSTPFKDLITGSFYKCLASAPLVNTKNYTISSCDAPLATTLMFVGGSTASVCATCLSFTYLGECVPACPLTAPLLNVRACVSSCPSGFADEANVCVACPTFFTQSTIQGLPIKRCYSQCPTTHKLKNGLECVRQCPAYVLGDSCAADCSATNGMYLYDQINFKVCQVCGLYITEPTAKRCLQICFGVKLEVSSGVYECFEVQTCQALAKQFTNGGTCADHCDDFVNENLVCQSDCYDVFVQEADGRKCYASCPIGLQSSTSMYKSVPECVTDCAPLFAAVSIKKCVEKCQFLKYEIIGGVKQCQTLQDLCLEYTKDGSQRKCEICTNKKILVDVTALGSVYECVDDCQTSLYVDGIECVAQCPNKQFRITAGIKTCDSCLGFIYQVGETNQCVDSCPSGSVQIFGTMTCVDTTQIGLSLACRMKRNQFCITDCSNTEYYLNKSTYTECVTECPTYQENNKKCVDSCYAGFNKGKICVNQCSAYDMFVDYRSCTSKCSFLSQNGQCTSQCSVGYKKFGSVCIQECANELGVCDDEIAISGYERELSATEKQMIGAAIAIIVVSIIIIIFVARRKDKPKTAQLIMKQGKVEAVLM